MAATWTNGGGRGIGLLARLAGLEEGSDALDVVEGHRGDRVCALPKPMSAASVVEDGVGDVGTIVLPGVARTIGVLQKLFGRAPVVLHGDERRTFVGVEIEPMVRVVDVGGVADAVDDILGDVGLGLCAEGVDACHVVHVARIAGDAVAIDLVAAHAVDRLRPSPTQRDSRVRHVADCVVGNQCICDPSSRNGGSSPIFKAGVLYPVVGDDKPTAELSRVLG